MKITMTTQEAINVIREAIDNDKPLFTDDPINRAALEKIIAEANLADRMISSADENDDEYKGGEAETNGYVEAMEDLINKWDAWFIAYMLTHRIPRHIMDSYDDIRDDFRDVLREAVTNATGRLNNGK